ncbi:MULTISPECIES: flagellar motor protein MotB [Paraburkholderia]|uniref:flagellar motor protein MotB n=1 Tax=Paraburkholderia TaxID=1822464 RepID=UPI0007ECCA2C|nr:MULTISPECIES: flagellar motor protein MotB [Paraburkholderia]MBB2980791.1 chemotaxis protein MotB [Paraburkholderia tropica]OBR48134.1 flagellar motor protein MotB [Paraburkholderia tropica]QNB16685.1 flagellar motor protein MotB [Paraburkholderia tropica]RQM46968.1 motility protein MotB [Paraburkholderia bannensis]
MSQRQRAAQDSESSKPAPVIRRVKKGGAHDAHHGGAWKIAYADFVTAMMAFFLLMWLLGSTSQYDRDGIEKYFNTPLSSMLGGKPNSANPSPSVINGGGHDLSNKLPAVGGAKAQPPQTRAVPVALAPADAADKARLQQLKAKLSALIEQKPALSAFKDQIRVTITDEGLRIELVDSLKRPMFATGSAKLEDYAYAILVEIGSALNDTASGVSIAGHTDSVPYSGGLAGYSNWELSSERANAARRALVAGHLAEDRLLQVRGLADVLPLDKGSTDSPLNRRISILVMNQAAERAFFEDAHRYNVAGQKAGTAS